MRKVNLSMTEELNMRAKIAHIAQFACYCKQFSIDIQTSCVDQTKRRVEHIFQILQSMLLMEMCLAGIAIIEQTNKFLES